MAIRNCLRSDKCMEIFYTTEKSDCTEVATLFFLRNDLYNEAIAYNKWIHNYRWEVYCPQNPTTLEQLGPNSAYKKIKFVRCPYDRAVSCYFAFCSMPTSIRLYIKKPNDTLSFSQYLSLALSKFKTLNRSVSRCDPHITTQSLNEECTQQIIWNHIIHVENMQKELENIGLSKISETIMDKHHWVKSKGFPPSKKCMSQIPFSKLDKKRLNYVDMYDPQCRQLVEKLYKIDFQCHPEYTWKAFLQRNS